MVTMTTVMEEDLAPLRRGLVAFCYQMLGSPFDAEDAVQEVMERAWRSRAHFDPSRASLSTWCYRIAHNVCVDRLRGAARRPLPRHLQDPGIEVGAPLVPALDVPWLMPAPTAWSGGSEPASAAERAVDVRLAVTAMLQSLPPRQRGVFVLREVLGYSATETAQVLESTVPAVNSALQRARAAVGRGATRPAPLRAGPGGALRACDRARRRGGPGRAGVGRRRTGDAAGRRPGPAGDSSTASSWCTCSRGADRAG